MASRRHQPRILIVCPAKPGTQFGNRILALRYQSIFKQLGYRTLITNELTNQYDFAVVLHAHRSAASVVESKSQSPERPVVLAVTGTDLYLDGQSAECMSSLALADRIVVSQPTMIADLPVRHRKKTKAIFQSARPLSVCRPENPRSLRVIVSGHLRDVKDPFRTAMAVRQLPPSSRIVVDHYGAALSKSMEKRAHAEMKQNSRYHWHGEFPRGEFRRKLATGWLMVLSSKIEGGANVLSEAVAMRTPVLASRIAGSTGLLDKNYSGLFEVGDTNGLRQLLLACETDQSLLSKLEKQIAARRHLVDPARERAAWRKLLDGLK